MKENKLATEDVGKLLFSLSLPAIIGQLVSLIYNIVDRIYIGHIPDIGGDALTGVGVTSPLIIIIAAFAALIGMGGAPRAAIMMGKGESDKAENTLGNSFTSLILLAVFLTVFFTIFNERLLLLFGASSVTLTYALDYMRIYTFGSIFVLLTLGLNPFISTQGFSKVSMATLLIGAVLNIILDPIFIFTLNLGVKGAALASVISQGVSAIWVVHFLLGDRTNLKIKKKYLSIKKDIMLPVIMLGLSPFVMQFTESLIFICFNVSLQKFGGDLAVGAMTILTSAMQFTFMPISGLTQGAQPIIGYNFGAGHKNRVKDTFRLLFIACFSYTSLFWLFVMLFPGNFVSIFTKDLELIKMAKWALRIYMGGGFLLGIQGACQQTFIALGNAKTSLFLALLRKVFLLIPLIFILPKFIENQLLAVFLAEPISDIIAVCVTSYMFFSRFEDILDTMV